MNFKFNVLVIKSIYVVKYVGVLKYKIQHSKSIILIEVFTIKKAIPVME